MNDVSSSSIFLNLNLNSIIWKKSCSCPPPRKNGDNTGDCMFQRKLQEGYIYNPIIIQYFPEHSESQIHGRSTCPAIIDLDVVGVSQQALVFHNHQQVAATTRNGIVCAAQQILALELRGTSRPSGGFILRCRNNLRMPEGCVETLGVVSRTPQIGGLVKISVNCQNGSKWIKMVMVTMEYNGS